MNAMQKYKVINTYPKSPYKVGDVLSKYRNGFDEPYYSFRKESLWASIRESEIKKHPHIFKPIKL